MKTVIEIPALVEATSSDEMVEASISLSAKDGQITLEIPEWESRIEIPAEHLTKALAALVPTTEKEPVNPVLVQHLGQKISRLEQQVASTPQQRLELEAMGETLEALRREVLPRLEALEFWGRALPEDLATLNSRDADFLRRIEGAEATIAEHHLSLSVVEQHLGQVEGRVGLLENNLAEPPAETAALSLYGGEQ